jgi:integrase
VGLSSVKRYVATYREGRSLAPKQRHGSKPKLDGRARRLLGEVGNLINPSNLRQRSFAPLLKRAGLPRITFHDLRHTCASLLFQKNVHPKFVQELLGHASVAITLDTYSHMLPGMGGEAADAIGEALV